MIFLHSPVHSSDECWRGQEGVDCSFLAAWKMNGPSLAVYLLVCLCLGWGLRDRVLETACPWQKWLHCSSLWDGPSCILGAHHIEKHFATLNAFWLNIEFCFAVVPIPTYDGSCWSPKCHWCPHSNQDNIASNGWGCNIKMRATTSIL